MISHVYAMPYVHISCNHACFLLEHCYNYQFDQIYIALKPAVVDIIFILSVSLIENNQGFKVSLFVT